MLEELEKYVVLIQLLVGSIFLSDHFFKPNKSFEEEKESLRKKLLTQLQGEDLSNYKITANSLWDNRTKKVSSSVVMLLVLYGCIVLFYCASPDRLPLGLFIESCLVSAFQIYAIFLYGKERTITHRIILYLTLLSCIVVFVLFFIIPDLYSIEIWFDRKNVYFNAWVLANFVLWFLVYVKCFKHYIKARTICLGLYDWQLLNKLDIRSRVQSITEQLSDPQCSYYDRIHLIRLGIRDLHKDDYYYTRKFDPNNNNRIYMIEKDLKDSLLNTIDTNLSGLSSKVFRRIITKKFRSLRVNPEEEKVEQKEGYFEEIRGKKTKQLEDILNRLFLLGIVSKIDD